MKKSTILVTGAGGFVGFATTKRLLLEGFHVKAFELTGSPYLANLNKLAESSPRLTVVPGNISKKRDVQRAVEGVEYVVHSAALLNSIAPRETFREVNVVGAKNVMEAAEECGIRRFLLVSTSDVFGIPDKDEVISEKTGYRQRQEPYADTKIEACEQVKEFCNHAHLDYTIIYPGWVYGPGDRQFFPAIIDMLKDKDVFLWHKSEPYNIDFIYIDDLVSAVTTALFNEQAKNEDFLILNDQANLTPEEIFSWMANHLDLNIRVHKVPYSLMMAIAKASQWLTQKGITKTHLLSTTDVKAFGNRFTFSADKARDILNWNPKVSEIDGFRQFFGWRETNE